MDDDQLAMLPVFIGYFLEERKMYWGEIKKLDDGVLPHRLRFEEDDYAR